MATILVVAHAHDRFDARHFLLKGLFEHWTAAGHRVLVHEGPSGLPDADLAFVHIDGTVIPTPYLDALSRYPIVVNGKTADISKRSFSRHLVSRADAFDGPVIVKTNRNSGGFPEAMHAMNARDAGEPPGEPVRFMKDRYPIFRSACEVPASTWRDPDLVVEKFLPEKDERGYYVRYWVFLGDKERCSRYLEADPIVKGDKAIERIPCDVPDEIRAWRARLGFDFGKFDFVIHDGQPVLLDVNRTPTVPPNLSDAVRAQQAALSEGIAAFLR